MRVLAFLERLALQHKLLLGFAVLLTLSLALGVLSLRTQDRLAGDTIPMVACLMAVADIYDGMISHRVYKPGMPHEEALDIIRQGGGWYFGSNVCASFLSTSAQFRATKARES